ncbi:uncharacterized protein A1O9_11333 [Exophiala aquamarina CBS 119918]|uniref:DUF6923 domain-containing protein n=1 Tax=Exophiala aquamarina CBS 119918 TaxID=1182545 RepID=A0A072NXZ6_9EURO|nr:uncharacterized protein A1O9_11333 [Exophiala aquamarina CBS 119918]KEF52491.1 hypothetical protein A1O9_11333 [Exophiala aquamarina CBS 119918]
MNAIGYNLLDNFIYGYAATDRTINRLAPDGTLTRISTLPASGSMSWNAGDIDSSGILWLNFLGTTWARVNMVPGASNFGSLVDSGSTTGLPSDLSVIDWVFLPGQGQNLYAIASRTGASFLYQFSMTTKAWTQLRSYGSVAGNTWGAGYAAPDGSLFASDNATGQIWRFPLNGAASFVSQGPVSSSNDGARCASNGQLN